MGSAGARRTAYDRHLTWPDRPPVCVVTVPLDFLVGLTAFLPVARLLLWVLRTGVLSPPRKQPAPKTCRGCGYDLTGNVSGVCPECGRAAA